MSGYDRELLARTLKRWLDQQAIGPETLANRINVESGRKVVDGRTLRRIVNEPEHSPRASTVKAIAPHIGLAWDDLASLPDVPEPAMERIAALQRDLEDLKQEVEDLKDERGAALYLWATAFLAWVREGGDSQRLEDRLAMVEPAVLALAKGDRDSLRDAIEDLKQPEGGRRDSRPARVPARA